MKTRDAILGRCAQLVGLFGLGMTALHSPASAIGRFTPDAAVKLAVATFHADPSASDGKLFLSMDRTLLDLGKGADPGPGQPALGTPVTRSALLVAPEESAQPGPALDASSPRAASHPAAAPGNPGRQSSSAESPSEDSAAPNESLHNPELLADLRGIMPAPGPIGPHFMAFGSAPTSLPRSTAKSLFCIGLLGLSLLGEDEQRGRGCERSRRGPISHSIIYLRIPLL